MAEHRHLEPLTVEECLDLAAQQPIGRLAVGSGDAPLVVPVTFLLDGTTVIFGTDRGTKLNAAGQRASFQVDSIDLARKTGWSVLFRGSLALADDETVDLEPWVGPRSHWLRLDPDRITGRRLLLEVPDLDGRGYR